MKTVEHVLLSLSLQNTVVGNCFILSLPVSELYL